MEAHLFNDFSLLHTIWANNHPSAIIEPLESAPIIEEGSDTSVELTHTVSVGPMPLDASREGKKQPLSFELTFLRDMETSLALKNKQKRTNAFDVSKVNELATRKNKKGGSRWMTLEEEQECSFQPSRSSQAKKAMHDPSCGYDFVERMEEGTEDLFLIRMDQGVEVKRRDLARKRGQAEYEARLDKKVCSNCHATQSYDEWKDKRKMCPRCKVLYKAPKKWRRGAWEDRMKAVESKARSRRVMMEHRLRQEELGLDNPELIKIRKNSEARMKKKNLRQKLLHESLTQTQHEQFDALLEP